MSRIYVASSWRNPDQPAVVTALRGAGHEVYDFRNPQVQGPQAGEAGLLNDGFRWSEIDPDWELWDNHSFRVKLTSHPLARAGFEQDMLALEWCEICVLVLPCGRSAHLEAGWAAGAGRAVVVLLLGPLEPELMYRMTHGIVTSIEELIPYLHQDTRQEPEGTCDDQPPIEETVALGYVPTGTVVDLDLLGKLAGLSQETLHDPEGTSEDQPPPED